MSRLIDDELTELGTNLHLIMEHDRIWNLKVAYSNVLAKVEELENEYCTNTISSVSLKGYLLDKLKELE